MPVICPVHRLPSSGPPPRDPTASTGSPVYETADDRRLAGLTTMAPLARPKPMVVVRRERRAALAVVMRTVRAAVWRRDQRRCRACAARTRLQLHHVQFRSHGGPWTTTNCMLLCRECHQDVHARILIVHGRDADAPEGLTFERRQWW